MKLNEVPQNYDKAASYYDWLTRVVFERILGLQKYRIRSIELLGNLDGATVLDLGCGTGRNFPLLVNRVGVHGRIVGVDYSAGMLEQARQHVRTEGWRNVELVRDDAVNIGSISTPVDAVTSAWCLGIVYDLDAALRRAVEVLRPGGKLSILDFGRSRPDHGPLWWLFPLYRCALQVTGIDAAEDLNKVGHRNDIYR